MEATPSSTIIYKGYTYNNCNFPSYLLIVINSTAACK
jgi:hypothetical protein